MESAVAAAMHPQRRLLVGGPVARTYSDQVHSAASRKASSGKYPMSTRFAGSWSYVTERNSRRPRTVTTRTIAIRRDLSNINHTPGSGVRSSCDKGVQCCTTRTG